MRSTGYFWNKRFESLQSSQLRACRLGHSRIGCQWFILLTSYSAMPLNSQWMADSCEWMLLWWESQMAHARYFDAKECHIWLQQFQATVGNQTWHSIRKLLGWARRTRRSGFPTVSPFTCSLRARLAASDLEGVEFRVLVLRLKKHVICGSLFAFLHIL